jgi:hypothetical protein
LRDEFGEPAEVLGDRRERELILSAFRTAQSKTSHLENALQVGEQHLDALALAARLLEGGGAGEGTGKVAGAFVQAAWDLASRCVGTASPFDLAGAAVQGASAVEQRRSVVDQVPLVVRVFPAGQV